MDYTLHTAMPAQGEGISIFDDLRPLAELYAPNAIYAFSLLCGPVFGSIMLAMNTRRTETRKGTWQVLLFGLGYQVLLVCLSQYIPHSNFGMGIALSVPGGLLLKNTFWNLYIGKDTPYKRRSVLAPVIIAIIIIVLLVLLIVYAEK